MWSDLARAARKQSVWDVAISAARFCVTYDDGRWAGSGKVIHFIVPPHYTLRIFYSYQVQMYDIRAFELPQA